MELDQSTEQKILAAAKTIFIKQGMAGARMQDIADAAGINKALLHYYFRNKDKLFETIFHEAIRDFIPRINEIIEKEAPLFQKIESFCREYICKLQENPFIPLFIMNEISRQPDEFIAKVFSNNKPNIMMFAMQISTAVQEGIIKPINPIQLIINMMSLCVFPFLSRPLFQRLSGIPDPMFDQLIEERKTFVPQFIIASISK